MLSPSPRPRLSRDFVVSHKRRRLIDALAELCAEQGFRATTVAQLCARARLARATFYEQFSGLEDAFLATVEAGVDEASRLAEDACSDSSEPAEERLRAALATLLDFVALRPEIGWVCLIEALTVMPRGFSLYEDAMRDYAESLRDLGLADPARPSQAAAEFAVDGIASILRTRLRLGDAEELPGLLPELSEFALQALRHPSVTTLGRGSGPSCSLR